MNLICVIVFVTIDLFLYLQLLVLVTYKRSFMNIFPRSFHREMNSSRIVVGNSLCLAPSSLFVHTQDHTQDRVVSGKEECKNI